MFKYYIQYQVSLTGTWMPMCGQYISKDEAKRQIKLIKKGTTIYRKELKYRVKKDK